MSTLHACRCATGTKHPPVRAEGSSLDVAEAVEAPCRCDSPAVAPSGRPDVDEHRHWSVVEWGLARPAADPVAAKTPHEG